MECHVFKDVVPELSVEHDWSLQLPNLEIVLGISLVLDEFEFHLDDFSHSWVKLFLLIVIVSLLLLVIILFFLVFVLIFIICYLLLKFKFKFPAFAIHCHGLLINSLSLQELNQIIKTLIRW